MRSFKSQSGKRQDATPFSACYLKSAKCEELGIHPGAILKGDLNFKSHNSNPHVEDAHYTGLNFHGACSGQKFKEILENSLSNSLSEGFGVSFSGGQKHIPHDQNANCSIITIKIKPNQLSIHEDQFKPGKIKVSFTDNKGDSYNYLSITDRGFYDYAEKHQSDGKLYEVTNLINQQEEVYLRVGLSRVHQAPDGRNGYWLQVNGIYTYPNFHDGVRTYE